MDDATVEGLTQRVERLERANRWWRIGATLLLVGVGAAFLMAASAAKPPDEMAAKKFKLVDDQGNQRGAWGTQPKGATFFELTGRDGRGGIKAIVVPTGEMSLALADINGRPRILMGIGTNNLPAVGLTDESGRPRVGIAVGPSASGLRLNGGDEAPLAELVVTKDDRVGLAFYGKSGKVVWKAP